MGGLVVNGSILIAERIAGDGFFQLGDGADVAGMEFRNFGKLFPLNIHGVLKAFGNIAIEILERGVVFQDAAVHFEIIDAAGKGIGDEF